MRFQFDEEKNSFEIDEEQELKAFYYDYTFFRQINGERSKRVGSNLNTIDMPRVSVIPM